MKLHRSFIILFILLVCSIGIISAQEIEKSTKTELIGGKNYYIHTVKPGQTIYGIAKAYSVDLGQIYAANPEIKSILQVGTVLKVPQVKKPEAISGINHVVEKSETLYKIATNYNLKVAEVIAANPGLTESIKPGQQIIIPLPVKKQAEPLATSLHIVQKGETLFSIASQYSTTVAELKRLNPAITENLQLGLQLKVPVILHPESKLKKDSLIIYECGKTGKQDSYNIAVMIPLYLDNLYNIDTGDLKTPTSSYKSLTFIQFYEGILMALDSLEKTGIAARVFVYDVAEDTSRTMEMLKKTEFATMNLIIGPLFSNNFSIVAKWANLHKVDIINPFTNRSDLIVNNPYAFKIIPSPKSEARQIISFIDKNYPTSNILIVFNDKEKLYADTLKTFFDAYELKNQSGLQINKIDYSAQGFSGVSGKLSDSMINIIITLIDGEAFVSTFLRNLNELARTNKILLFGRKSWEDYNNIEIEYLLNLNTHVFSNSFIDYSDNSIQNMVLNFRNKYKTDPDYYAYQGFDIMMYFTGALKSYGTNFRNCLDIYDPSLLCNKFHFCTSASLGNENTKGIIYRYENYKTINALLSPLKDIQLVVKKKPE
jgi:LysM repeat protein/ABC-type branched-subunit amino acid transport system substrate-binding protein